MEYEKLPITSELAELYPTPALVPIAIELLDKIFESTPKPNELSPFTYENDPKAILFFDKEKVPCPKAILFDSVAIDFVPKTIELLLLSLPSIILLISCNAFLFTESDPDSLSLFSFASKTSLIFPFI